MADVNVKSALYATPSVPPEGFECYWLHDEAGRNIGSINGPQCPETEALANKIAAAPEMYEALINVRKLIAEAAMTGFNCMDGDWADRLFASQQVTSAAIAKAEQS